MRLYLRKIILGLAIAGAVLLSMGITPAAAQAPARAANSIPTPGQFPPYKAPRTADGKPDFSGIWQAFVTADIDIQDHDAQPGPHPETMGAYGAWPGGQGIVEGGEIPYKPEALAKKKANAEKRMVVNITSDPHRHDTGDPSSSVIGPAFRAPTICPSHFKLFRAPDTHHDLLRVCACAAHDLHEPE